MSNHINLSSSLSPYLYTYVCIYLDTYISIGPLCIFFYIYVYTYLYLCIDLCRHLSIYVNACIRMSCGSDSSMRHIVVPGKAGLPSIHWQLSGESPCLRPRSTPPQHMMTRMTMTTFRLLLLLVLLRLLMAGGLDRLRYEAPPLSLQINNKRKRRKRRRS